jgi:hypothetical protein
VSICNLLLTLGTASLIRYSAVAGLALLYGQHVVSWLELPIFKTVGYLIVFVAIIGILYSIFRVVTTSRRAARQP